MQVSLHTLCSFAKSHELNQMFVFNIGKRKFHDASYVLTQDDINEIGHGFNVHEKWIENATLEQLDSSEVGNTMFSPLEDARKTQRLNALRHQQLQYYSEAKAKFIDMLKLLGMELPSSWQE